MGDPRDGKGARLPRHRVVSPHCPRRAGSGPVLGPYFRKSRLTPFALGGGRKTALWQGRGGPFPIRAGPAESAPGLTAGGSGGEGASRRE